MTQSTSLAQVEILRCCFRYDGVLFLSARLSLDNTRREWKGLCERIDVEPYARRLWALIDGRPRSVWSRDDSSQTHCLNLCIDSIVPASSSQCQHDGRHFASTAFYCGDRRHVSGKSVFWLLLFVTDDRRLTEREPSLSYFSWLWKLWNFPTAG